MLLYAGNVGYSQSLELLVEAARRRPDVTVLINGDGSARPELERAAAGLANVRFAGYVPEDRLGEVLATGDIHAVPLRRGLARVSVPSKIYSILAAGRPVVAAIDAGHRGAADPRRRPGPASASRPMIRTASWRPSSTLVDEPDRAIEMGRRGRQWVERAASPAAVAEAYERLVVELRACAGAIASFRGGGRFGTAGAPAPSPAASRTITRRPSGVTRR